MELSKDSYKPLSQSKYVLAKYGIQVIDAQFDPVQHTVAVIPPHDELHYHLGPTAIECKTNAGKWSCDRDSWMRIFWGCCFPCAMVENCCVSCCACCWECLSLCLRHMEEHYTFKCCDYCKCCKMQEN